jgi:hypothetical protein
MLKNEGTDVLIPSTIEAQQRKLREIIEAYKMKPVATVYSSSDGKHIVIVVDKNCPQSVKDYLFSSQTK